MNSHYSHKKSGVGSALEVSSKWKISSAFSASPSPHVLTVRYVSASAHSNVLEVDAPHILAVIRYGEGHSGSSNESRLNIDVNLSQLFQPPVCEVWGSSVPVLYEQVNGIRIALADETVFGCLEVQESPGGSLEDVARSVYQRIFEYCTESGFSHLLRMWNYFPSINVEQSGLERYKRFCLGRHQAFSAYYNDFASILPAASAVGTQSGPFRVLFLASKQAGKPFENPRQISAYKYPPMYGPESPSFARATVCQTETDGQLFVAGTASIVGHASRHQGDPARQTLETLSNIGAVLNRVPHEGLGTCCARSSEGLLKVFVRHQEDWPAVREVLEGHELGTGPILYVQGEMCRKELLVEIEGIWNLEFLSSE